MLVSRYTTFLQLYNQLADYLANLAEANDHERFFRLIDLAAERSSVVKHHVQALKALGDFRNTIVHNNDFADEPTEATLKHFQALAQTIFSPKPLIPTFQKEIRCFELNESLSTVLSYMRQTGYSQVVIMARNGLALLTLECIARWLTSVSAQHDLVQLKQSPIEDVLKHERSGSFMMMSRQQTIYDAREAFGQRIGPNKVRLHAIIITEHGRITEKPLGLVTPWDVLESTDLASSEAN